MEPITREEYYLAKIAGTYKGKTPEPVTIDEYYLATMAGDYSGNTPPSWKIQRGIVGWNPLPSTANQRR